MHDLFYAFDQLATFQTVLWIIIGSILGIILGALPGLTATMGVALMLPISLYLPTATGMAMLLAVYEGAVSGASIPAILLGIPGNPNALATTIDGYAMTRKGQAGLALGSAAVASLIGGLISLIILTLFAPYLASAALAFGPAEKCTLAALGLLIIAAMSKGAMARGIAMGAFGVGLSLLGPDPFTDMSRMPFADFWAGTPMQSGISLIPALIGLFGITQALVDLEDLTSQKGRNTTAALSNGFPSLRKLRSMWRVLLESSFVGTLIGAIPGAGASVAVFLAHERARNLTVNAPEGERVGDGCVEGVMAPEVANNAVTGGALIPVLALGIPGDAVTSILLGALLIHGVVPGPDLFTNDLGLVYSIFLGMGIALIAMFIFQLVGVRLFPLLLRVPPAYLVPVILIFSIIGTYAADGQAPMKATFNMGISILFGILGFVLRKGGYPLVPLVLGLILGPMLESNYRLAVKLNQGDLWTIFKSPLAGSMLLIAAVLVGFSLWQGRKDKKTI